MTRARILPTRIILPSGSAPGKSSRATAVPMTATVRTGGKCDPFANVN